MKLLETRYGAMMVPNNDTIIGRSLELYGEWGQAELDFLLPLAQDGVVVDVGANVGTHTLAFASVARKVYAFEPQKLVYMALCGNVAINDLENVDVIPGAAGARFGSAFMPVVPITAAENFGALHLVDAGNPVMVTMIDLLGLDTCDLIKMDIEGHEYDALLGAVETLKACKPKLYLEAKCDREPIYGLLASLGYRWETHTAPAYNPDNWHKYDGDIFGGYAEESLYAYHGG